MRCTRAVPLPTIQSDDAALDAIGAGNAAPTRDRALELLRRWREDVDSEPLPEIGLEDRPES